MSNSLTVARELAQRIHDTEIIAHELAAQLERVPREPASIEVDGYSLPVGGDPLEWYFASMHHPGWTDGKKPHSGLDINLLLHPRGDVELGYPTYATCNGLVVYAQWAPGRYWGNLVITASIGDGDDLLFWRYAHLDGMAVKVGDILAAGDALGTIGKGAADYFAHLHLDCWYGPMLGVHPGAWFDRRVMWLDPLALWDGKWEWGEA